MTTTINADTATGGAIITGDASGALGLQGAGNTGITISSAGVATLANGNQIGYLNIPNSGAKTTSYTLVAGDVGKFIELGTSGTVVVPASVTTVYKGGTDADIASFSVTTRGVATILFITATVAVVTGNLA